MKIKKITKNLGLIAVSFLAIFILSLNLNKPFIGHHDFTNAFDGTIAKNYLKYGILNIKFGQISSLISTDILNPANFYTHYPPLLTLLVAFSFGIFGVVEWAERLVPAIFSLIGVISLYLICQKVWNRRIAFFGALFYILNPMFIYFGSMAVPDPPALGLSLLGFYLYLKWLDDKQDNKIFFWLCLAFIIRALLSWTIFYFGILLILHSLIVKKFEYKLFLPTLIIFFGVILQLIHAYFLTGSLVGGGIIQALNDRLNGQNLSFGGLDFSLKNYLRQEISWIGAYFTKTMLVLSFLGVLAFFKKNNRIQNATLLMFFLFGALHIAIFSKYIFVHDFLNIYLLPFLAIAAALGLDKIYQLLSYIKISKFVKYIVIATILVFFSLEKISFTKALLATDMNKPGLVVANILNSLQTDPNQVVILSPRFSSFYGVFANYYSNYPFTTSDEQTLIKTSSFNKYKYIITIDQDIQDKSFYDNLIQKFKSQKIDDLTIIFTNETI